MSGLIHQFASQFEASHKRSLELLSDIPAGRLFWKPRRLTAESETYSAGELLIRSAAAVERTFGGITRRLWDDPFEWTLPEALTGHTQIIAYFDEVEKTCRSGFTFFSDDSVLFREIPAPEQMKPIAQVLFETLLQTSHLQGRAFGVAQQFLRLRPVLT